MTVIKKERVIEGDIETISPDHLTQWLRTGGVVEKKAADRIEKLERENQRYRAALEEIVEIGVGIMTDDPCYGIDDTEYMAFIAEEALKVEK